MLTFHYYLSLQQLQITCSIKLPLHTAMELSQESSKPAVTVSVLLKITFPGPNRTGSLKRTQEHLNECMNQSSGNPKVIFILQNANTF